MMENKMTVLVVGASGATGRLLVEQLLQKGHHVRVVVRSTEALSACIEKYESLEVTCGSLLELRDEDLTRLVQGCDAVASCLGHNLTLKGLFGKPRRLVTDATCRLCEAIKNNDTNAPTKFALMNTTGVRNRDLVEPVSVAQKCVIGLLRVLLPPHADNEQAADYLRTKVGREDRHIEWVVVRPDGLVDHDKVSEYELHPSPTRSAIFNAGQTSRINVASFMAELIADDEKWNQWKGQMSVIYNSIIP